MPSSPPSRPRTRVGPWLFGVTVVLLAGGGAVWIAERDGSTSPDSAAVVAAPTTTTATTTTTLEPGWERVVLPSGKFSVALPGPSTSNPSPVEGPVEEFGNLEGIFNVMGGTQLYRGTEFIVMEIEMSSSALLPTTAVGFRDYFQADPSVGEVEDAWSSVPSPLGVAIATKVHDRTVIYRMFAVAHGRSLVYLMVQGPRGTEAAADHAILLMAATLTAVG